MSTLVEEGHEEENDKIAILRQKIKEIQCWMQAIKKDIKSANKTMKKTLEKDILDLEAKKSLLYSQIEELKNQVYQEEEEEVSEHLISITLPVKSKIRLTKWQKMKLQQQVTLKDDDKDPSLYVNKQLEEDLQLKSQLAKEGFIYLEMPSDGHCLFHAISHQLQTLLSIPRSIHELRKLAAHHISLNVDRFLPFYFDEEEGEEGNSNSCDNSHLLQQHCHQIETTSAWGGHLEIMALSETLKICILIYQANQDILRIGEQFYSSSSSSSLPIRISYHHYALGLGEHYNSVIKSPSIDTNNNTHISLSIQSDNCF